MNRERRKALQAIIDQLETLQTQLEETSPKTSRAANGTSISKRSAKACPMQ